MIGFPTSASPAPANATARFVLTCMKGAPFEPYEVSRKVTTRPRDCTPSTNLRVRIARFDCASRHKRRQETHTRDAGVLAPTIRRTRTSSPCPTDSPAPISTRRRGAARRIGFRGETLSASLHGKTAVCVSTHCEVEKRPVFSRKKALFEESPDFGARFYFRKVEKESRWTAR